MVELSSSVIINMLSETNISSVNPVYPSTPLKGATIFPLSRSNIKSPFFTFSLSLNSPETWSFLILKVLLLLEMAVPKVSNFSENFSLITSVTIIPAGGL